MLRSQFRVLDGAAIAAHGTEQFGRGTIAMGNSLQWVPGIVQQAARSLGLMSGNVDLHKSCATVADAFCFSAQSVLKLQWKAIAFRDRSCHSATSVSIDSTAIESWKNPIP